MEYNSCEESLCSTYGQSITKEEYTTDDLPNMDRSGLKPHRIRMSLGRGHIRMWDVMKRWRFGNMDVPKITMEMLYRDVGRLGLGTYCFGTFYHDSYHHESFRA